MSIEQNLLKRCNSKCELCTAEVNLTAYEVTPTTFSNDNEIMICNSCKVQIDKPTEMDANHWRCLNETMWSTVPAVQVMAFRMLNRLSSESWVQGLLDILYLEDDVKAWAEAGIKDESTGDSILTLDSNGTKLENGDTVTLIKDLVVKGANFTAKRGTTVRNISLTSNPEHVEGHINGVHIVLVSAFLKKSN